MRGYELGAAMSKVIFDAVQRDPVQPMAKKKGCMLFTILRVREVPILGRDTAHVSPHQQAFFRLLASRKARSAYICHAESRRSTRCFHSTKYRVCNVSTTGLSRRRYGPVELQQHHTEKARAASRGPCFIHGWLNANHFRHQPLQTRARQRPALTSPPSPAAPHPSESTRDKAPPQNARGTSKRTDKPACDARP